MENFLHRAKILLAPKYLRMFRRLARGLLTPRMYWETDMTKHPYRWIAAIALAVVLSTGAAWADRDGHGRGGHGNAWTGNNGGSHQWRGHDRDRDRDGDRDDMWRGGRHGRGSYGYFHRSESGRPRGWDRGHKTGWGDCDMPPGQAKKYGCSPSFGRSTRYPIVIHHRRPTRRPVYVAPHYRVQPRPHAVVARDQARDRYDLDHDRR